MAVNVLCLFLAVLWVGLYSVIFAFPGHTNYTLLWKKGEVTKSEDGLAFMFCAN